MVDYVALKAELAAGHPDTGPYSPDDAVAADQLNAVNRTRNRTSMTGDEVFQATDSAEFNALDNGSGTTSDVQHRWITFTRSQDIDPFATANVQLVISIFGNPSATVSNLQALRVESISRGVELELGVLKVGDITTARSI